MCQFCFAMERMKTQLGEEVYDTGSDALFGLLHSHFSPQRAEETLRDVMRDEHIDVPHDAALKLFKEGIIAGTHVNAYMMFGMTQENIGILRLLHERIAKMAQEFKDTPTVMASLGAIMLISSNFAHSEVDAAMTSIMGMASDLGVRTGLLIGEDKQEDMIDEEFAMIGQRCKARNPARHAAIVILLGLRGIPPTTPEIGRALVTNLITGYRELRDLADKYVLNGEMTFVKRAAQMMR